MAAAIDHVMNARKRGISDQMEGWKTVSFEENRVVALGDQRFSLTVSGAINQMQVAFSGEAPLAIATDWVPGQPVWQGEVAGETIALQVRVIANGVSLAHAGTFANIRVLTAREAELDALMPEKLAADTGKHLLCPMPGLVKSIAVVEGQEV